MAGVWVEGREVTPTCEGPTMSPGARPKPAVQGNEWAEAPCPRGHGWGQLWA